MEKETQFETKNDGLNDLVTEEKKKQLVEMMDL